MCVTGKTWCKGIGYFDKSKMCLACQSASAVHQGWSSPKPAPASWSDRPLISEPPPQLSPKQPTGGTKLIAAVPASKPVAPAQKPPLFKVARKPETAETEGAPTDPYARKPGESTGAYEARLLVMKGRPQGGAPKSLSGYIFRGEDPAGGGKSGRTPKELIGHGGFAPWQIAKPTQVLPSLVTLCSGSPTLQERAYAWQKAKNKVDGYFVSTGTNEKEAYNNYTFFYRVKIPDLMRRAWDAAGITGLNPDNVRDCHLYTDRGTVADSSFVAILCLTEASRVYELLVMTPIPYTDIELKKGGVWSPLPND